MAMSKKAQRDAWMYGLVGFGVAAVVAYPFLKSIVKYWTSDAPTKAAIDATLTKIAA